MIIPKKIKLDKVSDSWFKRRLTSAMMIVFVAFMIIFLRLFFLQIIKGESFYRLSENNCIRLQKTIPQRGLIFDRNGNILVKNRASFDLYITKKDAKPLDETVKILSKYVKIPTEKILEMIKDAKASAYKPILIQRDIKREILAEIEANKFELPGVTIQVNPQRFYINNNRAAHILGHLGEISLEDLKDMSKDDTEVKRLIGKTGVEKVFEKELKGQYGQRQIEVNAKGQTIQVLKTLKAKSGNNIFLTIDNNLQAKAESVLEGLAGVAIVIDYDSGEILACASAPDYDQNVFLKKLSIEEWNSLRNNPFLPLLSKAIQGEYPPASIYKIITAMAALEEKVINKYSKIECEGFLHVGDRKFKCWDKHGSLNIVDALAQSCDVFFYQVGKKLGVEKLAWYAKASGLGYKTDIDLPNESTGLIPTKRWKREQIGQNWFIGDTISLSIGQGYNLVTPMQIASLVAAVANGGKVYKPLIVKKITKPDGEILFEDKAKVKMRLPVSDGNLSIIQKGLFKAVYDPHGTGHICAINGIRICAKTGTAQVISNKDDEEGERVVKRQFSKRIFKPHAWFVAYARLRKQDIKYKNIAVVVLVEHGEFGAHTSGPIAKELIKAYYDK